MNLTWHSDFLDSSYNRARVNNAAIDYLMDGIVANQQDKETLIYWGRAFDRVFQHQSYMILQWYLPEFWVAHVNKFGKPEVWPKYGGINAWKYWWIDENKWQLCLKTCARKYTSGIFRIPLKTCEALTNGQICFIVSDLY